MLVMFLTYELDGFGLVSVEGNGWLGFGDGDVSGNVE